MLRLSLLMVVMGNTVRNIAIPTLIRELDASNADLQWTIDAYSLVFAGLLFTGGALGDRFGRKGALTAGLLVFGLGSALASQADSAAQVIACRALMGAAAGVLAVENDCVKETIEDPSPPQSLLDDAPNLPGEMLGSGATSACTAAARTFGLDGDGPT